MRKTAFQKLEVKWYGLPKQTIPLQIFKGCLPQNLLGPFLDNLSHVMMSWNNSKTALYYIIKLGQVKEFFWTCFVTWRATYHYMVCTPTPTPFLLGGLNFLPNFQKGEALRGRLLEKREVAFLQEGVQLQFYKKIE